MGAQNPAWKAGEAEHSSFFALPLGGNSKARETVAAGAGWKSAPRPYLSH